MSGRAPNVFISAHELIELGMCPFRDGRFDIKPTDPCPVCGALGTNDEEADDLCVDSPAVLARSPSQRRAGG
jgi:hypothetical protein